MCWPEESEQQQEEEEHRDPHRHSSKGGYGGEEGCTKKGEAQHTEGEKKWREGGETKNI